MCHILGRRISIYLVSEESAKISIEICFGELTLRLNEEEGNDDSRSQFRLYIPLRIKFYTGRQ